MVQKNRAGDWSTDGIQVSGCSSMSASSAEGAPKRTESCKESHPSNLDHVFDEQSWLSHHARIQLKILTLTVKTHRRLAPKCFGLIQPPLTAHSVPSNRLDLFSQYTVAAMVQPRFFASIGSSIWKAITSARSTILSPLEKKTCFFALGTLLKGSP